MSVTAFVLFSLGREERKKQGKRRKGGGGKEGGRIKTTQVFILLSCVLDVRI